MPTLSVIVPVYNAELYIGNCIHSILGQSYPNYELIIVNDGSKDDSGRICDDLASIHKNITVIHINNSGASRARNIGLDAASGEYVWFIDADDWICDGFLSGLDWNDMPDILFFGFIKRLKTSNEICKIQSTDEKITNDLDAALTRLFKSKNQYFGYTWNKIFRRSVITDNNLRFRENLIIKEDEVFTLDFCKYASTLKISASSPYNYRILPESVSHSPRNKKTYFELACVLENEIDSINHLTNLQTSFKNAILSYYYTSLFEESNVDIDLRIDKYLNYYLHNKNQIKLPKKNRRIPFMMPTYYLKKKLLKLYINIKK